MHNQTSDHYLNIHTDNSSFSNEKLEMAYIGVNYDKLKNKKFSIPAFFLSYFYTSYRRFHPLTIKILIILTALSLFEDYILYPVYILVSIYVGFKFNKWYLKFVNDQIKEIQNSNPNLSEEQLVELCNLKGKPSIVASILSLVIYTIIVFIIRFIIAFVLPLWMG